MQGRTQAKMIDTESAQCCRHALDEIRSAGETLFRGVWLITENKCYEQLPYRYKMDDGSHLNRVSHWQKALKRIHYVKFAARHLWKSQREWECLEEMMGSNDGRLKKSWANCFKNVGEDFIINFHHPNHASGLQVGINSLLYFSLFYTMWRALT